MPRETEIKLRVRDEKALRRALKHLGARPLSPNHVRVHEQNVIFDTPQGGLAKHGQLLRIRTETPQRASAKGSRGRPSRTVLTFKRPPAVLSSLAQHGEAPGRHKVREEFELEVSNAAVLTSIFEGLGMSGWFHYEKYRTTYCLPARSTWAKGLLLELDETPIGTFVELEGQPGAIDRAAHELGYGKRDFILKNYLALYLEECRREGREPRNMLFATPPDAAPSKKSK
jgi:adenylate cyclase class 2